MCSPAIQLLFLSEHLESTSQRKRRCALMQDKDDQSCLLPVRMFDYTIATETYFRDAGQKVDGRKVSRDASYHEVMQDLTARVKLPEHCRIEGRAGMVIT